MTETSARVDMLRRIVTAAEDDPRVTGVVDYGSSGEGRADEWSDVDVALFVRDEDLAGFEAGWIAWAGQFGRLLLAYVGGVGHPWTVYEAEPVPLRVDFAFQRASQPEVMLEWPNAPQDAAAMVLYDAQGGSLTAVARQLVGRSLAPDDLGAAFARVCGDFWYYVVRTYCKLRRGDHWAARYDFNYIVTGLLHSLLRIEAGAVDRWQVQQAQAGLEWALSPDRLHALDRCIPDATAAGLGDAMLRAAELGRDVCVAIAAAHGWSWPADLAGRMIELLAAGGE